MISWVLQNGKSINVTSLEFGVGQRREMGVLFSKLHRYAFRGK